MSRRGELWIGTWKGGLSRMDVERRTFKSYRASDDPRAKGALADDQVRALFEDLDGKVWIGTFGGLHLLDPITESVVVFRSDPGRPDFDC